MKAGQTFLTHRAHGERFLAALFDVKVDQLEPEARGASRTYTKLRPGPEHKPIALARVHAVLHGIEECEQTIPQPKLLHALCTTLWRGGTA
jgi:hypothetical protein